VNISLTQKGMDTLLKRIGKIERALKSPGVVKRDLGRLLVAQTKRRIQTEKTSPDGRPWMKWSPSYAATRGAGHSLLMDTHELFESIKARVRVDGVSINSDRTYAAFVNRTRTFLGVSRSNSKEFGTLVQKWMSRL
jgi:hypothetical protein